MKDKRIKIKQITASTVIATLVLAGGYSCARNFIPPEENAIIKTKDVDDKTQEEIFNPGEHIIVTSPKFKRGSKSPIQLDYHEGYELKGINNDTDIVKAIYVNNETVIATSTGLDEKNNLVYSEFGKTINKKENREDNIYQEKEHILAIPITKPNDDNYQIEYHEGYEVVDITAYTYGRLLQYGGGYIVYTNITPVKCENNLEFGTPLENSYTKYR